jgi:hypothetical protein
MKGFRQRASDAFSHTGRRIALLLAMLLFSPAAQAEPAPDLTLTGSLTGADHQTYREVPFRVPAGVTRLTVTFAYTGKAQKAVIDIGLRDPQRFRGWSGGNKAQLTISEADATPSYLPGPLPAGAWALVLGVPNMRAGAHADFTARIVFQRGADTTAGFSDASLERGPAWYRGDLHMHTAHSDGACLSRRGVRAPCPVFRTLEAAEARHLDFIAITDHNATSQNEALRELAPYFDDLLLIPGREVTTFFGHANVFGVTGPLDFRTADIAALQAQAHTAGGLFSINHPGLPSGEACMGCGWTAKATDFAHVDAIEAVNGGALGTTGGNAEGFLSSIPFWEARLNQGLRITAIGGSDNHDAGLDPARPSAVGYPATAVHASELSQAAILDGIRRGHVFVDVQGRTDRTLEAAAHLGPQTAEMGDALTAPAGATVILQVHVLGAAGGAVTLAGDAARLGATTARTLTGPDETPTFNLVSDGRRHWIRADVRGPDGRLWLLGNPIYLNPEPPAAD